MAAWCDEEVIKQTLSRVAAKPSLSFRESSQGDGEEKTRSNFNAIYNYYYRMQLLENEAAASSRATTQ